MVALNFSPEFAGPVERREKLQTIRSTPRANVGDRLQLYTGQRTKLCRKLSAIDPVCTEVIEVGFDQSFVRIGHAAIGQSEFDAFARRDGFGDFAAMYLWFARRYKSTGFIGFLHRWSFDE